MMNRVQYLLGKLAEEANEIGQIALKAQQFGLDETCPDIPLTNAQRTHLEIDDLMAIVEQLNDEFDFGYVPSEERKGVKKAKVHRYYEYSKLLGQVEEDDITKGFNSEAEIIKKAEDENEVCN